MNGHGQRQQSQTFIFSGRKKCTPNLERHQTLQLKIEKHTKITRFVRNKKKYNSKTTSQ
jgi:hypothetical protein